MMFPNDHPTPHVHVFGHGCEALLFLNCPAGPLTVREKYGVNQSQVKRIRTALQAYVPKLCAKWEEMHGNK